MEQFDYIIIGAGSAACVLAERLSASGKHSVAVLEAGGDGKSPWISLPLGYGKTYFDETVNWKYTAQPEAALDGRAAYWPRGKGVGGSGSINALIYARGLPHDFNDWERAGAAGWGWNTVRQTYEALETRCYPDGKRSGSGPLYIQDVSDQVHPSTRHFFNAATELGIPNDRPINADDAEGAASYWINTYKGRRNSSARAFLKPALRRANVSLRTHAMVEKIGINDGQARTVTYTRGGQTHTMKARREIILSAGSVTSPRLLQLSGVGPAQMLIKHGIRPFVDLPHVGGNLQDHLGINYYFRAREKTLNNQLAPFWGKVKLALRYALTRRGALALSVNQCGGYFRSAPELDLPDQQLYFNPVTYTLTPEGKRSVIKADPFPGFIIGFQPSRPTSRGRIDISGSDPLAAPLIQPNSLSTDTDIAQVIAGARLCQLIMNTDAMTHLVDGAMDPDIRNIGDDDTILADFRKRSGTVFHPVGTCRMGTDAETSVVDPSLRVHGVAGLRVVDASVFPNITSANTNAPTMMLAYRAAQLILEDA